MSIWQFKCNLFENSLTFWYRNLWPWHSGTKEPMWYNGFYSKVALVHILIQSWSSEGNFSRQLTPDLSTAPKLSWQQNMLTVTVQCFLERRDVLPLPPSSAEKESPGLLNHHINSSRYLINVTSLHTWGGVMWEIQIWEINTTQKTKFL